MEAQQNLGSKAINNEEFELYGVIGLMKKETLPHILLNILLFNHSQFTF